MYKVIKTFLCTWLPYFYHQVHRYFLITLYYQLLHLTYLCNLARYWLRTPWRRQSSVETCRSVIISEIIVCFFLVMVPNTKMKTGCHEIWVCSVKQLHRHQVWKYSQFDRWVKRKPTWCHLFYYFIQCSFNNMFRPLIRPSSGACD